MVDVVFVGKFVRLDEGTFTYYFQVSQQLKGFPQENVDVIELTPENSPCGEWFDVGREYLVYAYYHDDPPRFSTGFCMGNNQLEKAIENLRQIEYFSAVIQPERFDFDQDGVVDMRDVFILADHYFKQDVVGDITGDFSILTDHASDLFDPNGDGAENLDDFFIFADAFGWRRPARLITAYMP